ncbi:MAG: ExbD/TolR family protein [Gammaproteobacteria bacterium]|jgi:biopolymer transport protein ExbD
MRLHFDADVRPRRWLSLTPLIDIVFLLLVFFMLATQFAREQALPLDVPGRAVASSDASLSGALLVRVRATGEVDIAGQGVTLDQLQQRVSALVSARGEEHRVILRSEQGLDLQRLVQVLDRVRDAGATHVSLRR